MQNIYLSSDCAWHSIRKRPNQKCTLSFSKQVLTSRKKHCSSNLRCCSWKMFLHWNLCIDSQWRKSVHSIHWIFSGVVIPRYAKWCNFHRGMSYSALSTFLLTLQKPGSRTLPECCSKPLPCASKVKIATWFNADNNHFIIRSLLLSVLSYVGKAQHELNICSFAFSIWNFHIADFLQF